MGVFPIVTEDKGIGVSRLAIGKIAVEYKVSKVTDNVIQVLLPHAKQTRHILSSAPS